MEGIGKIALAAALALLSPFGVVAQDDAVRPQSVERLQGVPEDFTLPPGPEAAPANRMEPMVQPLPQPSATPTIAASPALDTLPQDIAAPEVTPGPEPAPERRTQVASPARLSVDEPAVEQEPSQEEAERVIPQDEQPPAAPSVVAEAAQQQASEEGMPSGRGIVVWLLGGLLLAALAALAVWWLLRRGEDEMVVEKIEPYRPPPSPSQPEHSPQPEAQAQPTGLPSGLVHASRPAPAANPGGFVTSTIATRPRQQEPRRYTSSDGRIVTSLAPRRD